MQQRSRSPRSPPAAAPGAVLCEADPDLALTVGAISVRGGLKYGYLMREGGGRPLRAAALPEEVPGIQGPRAPAARRGLFSAAGKGVRSRGGRRQLPRASRLPGQRGTARRPFRPLCLPFISLQANRDSLGKCYNNEVSAISPKILPDGSRPTRFQGSSFGTGEIRVHGATGRHSARPGCTAELSGRGEGHCPPGEPGEEPSRPAAHPRRGGPGGAGRRAAGERLLMEH